jgi:MoxR-like ATPase
MRGFADLFEAITANVAQVLHGKRDAIEFAVMCLLAEGHLLIEDVPGVGKTSLAKALAASIDCSWKRIQFTPDLLPTDLVGVSIYQRSTESCGFEPGPLFA